MQSVNPVAEKFVELYDWARTTGSVVGKAIFRQSIHDFIVEETLRFEPSGQGAHHLLYIEKRNVNTDIVTHKLRRFAQVKPTDIGYAGKKDRFAIARQWFSVQLPLLQEIDWQTFNDDEVQVLKTTRHDKKLRIGAVKHNQFKITLRDFVGDKERVEQKIQQIEQHGFANYFGEQRFGHNGDNLTRGLELLQSNKRLKNRNLQGLLFSAVRSYLFNHVLSERAKRDGFTELFAGDYVQLDGSESGFTVTELANELPRFQQKDLHPTAPMPGRGRSNVSDQVLAFEQEVLAPYRDIIEQLQRKGLNAERRAIRIFPKNVKVLWHNDAINEAANQTSLELSFSLPKGAFATSFLRELVELDIVRNNENTVE
ncbi:MAG: tRNA pseudouridine(13) synthase TruD [Kangiellaceae bacterium]|nr:tRNA pseudouridine(13) synthase TruD [Kangiellaceae bacterium]